jgi:hypothetical protein
MPSPFGEITFRKIDHQSTLGAFVGKTALKDGKGVMVDSVYRKGATICRAMRKSKSFVRRIEAFFSLAPLLRGEGRGEGPLDYARDSPPHPIEASPSTSPRGEVTR